MVSDDENNQAVTNDAFEVLHFIAAKRLALGRLTVIDATNVQPEARKPLVELARQVPLPPRRHRAEPARAAVPGPQPSARRPQLRPARHSPAAIATAAVSPRPRTGRLPPCFRAGKPRRSGSRRIERVPLWNDKRQEHGPFDIIGDVHGCCDELEELLLQHWATRSRLTRRRAVPCQRPGVFATRRAARPSSSAIWWTVAPAFWTRCGSCGTWFIADRHCAFPATTT